MNFINLNEKYDYIKSGLGPYFESAPASETVTAILAVIAFVALSAMIGLFVLIIGVKYNEKPTRKRKIVSGVTALVLFGLITSLHFNFWVTQSVRPLALDPEATQNIQEKYKIPDMEIASLEIDETSKMFKAKVDFVDLESNSDVTLYFDFDEKGEPTVQTTAIDPEYIKSIER